MTNEYQVLWIDDGPIINTLVTTNCDTSQFSERDWIELAAFKHMKEMEESDEEANCYVDFLRVNGYTFIGVLPGDTEWVA